MRGLVESLTRKNRHLTEELSELNRAQDAAHTQLLGLQVGCSRPWTPQAHVDGVSSLSAALLRASDCSILWPTSRAVLRSQKLQQAVAWTAPYSSCVLAYEHVTRRATQTRIGFGGAVCGGLDAAALTLAVLRRHTLRLCRPPTPPLPASWPTYRRPRRARSSCCRTGGCRQSRPGRRETRSCWSSCCRRSGRWRSSRCPNRRRCGRQRPQARHRYCLTGLMGA